MDFTGSGNAKCSKIVLTTPNTDLVVGIDTTDGFNLHPQTKIKLDVEFPWLFDTLFTMKILSPAVRHFKI